jgi:hypothetical protein
MYNAWWSGDDKSVLVRLEGHDSADKIAYVIRTQKTFWEIDQLEYIAMVGPSGGIYLDVGSNIGNHAVFFGRFCADHVVAIEPNPAPASDSAAQHRRERPGRADHRRARWHQ